MKNSKLPFKNLCSEGHDEIGYNDLDHCPVCFFILRSDDLQLEVDDLNNDISELEYELRDVLEELDELK